MEKKLHRIPDQAVLGGVASGIAQYFNIDVVIVRVLLVVMLLLPIPPTFGMTAFIYIILWAVLPTGPAGTIYTTNTSFDPTPNTPSDPVWDKKKSDQTVMVLGGVLIFFGAVMLVDDFPLWYQFKQYFWPIVLIAIGAFLILRQRDKEHHGNTTVYPTTPPPPVDPIAPDPEPQPYTPFTPSSATTTTTTHFPEDPEARKPDDEDDQVIKVN
ncbi:PspC domain-containing protein [Dyadobacter chenhuakuii]|uniref:PspC domain-containing protein n=1 Tax=Dyadobacter chenhuakuii TaxID=2909339 RepID=A0ABY4XKL2_9BACT|nr:PspC domain-containing protein [Dyadobacter chenhuakuii]MCF2493641.1 PspC domain-containing protein [Dyadobacter chenhuakuii]USJ30776.1 PspC domain-containing protein [Dyadobacter chenhuakuii]